MEYQKIIKVLDSTLNLQKVFLTSYTTVSSYFEKYLDRQQNNTYSSKTLA